MSHRGYSALIFLIIAATLLTIVDSTTDPVIVSRSEWHARSAKQPVEMKNPVPYVVIHHSYIPPACNSSEECIKAMRWMQDYHQDNHSWSDIGYHFAVGGDGRVYEGRGWSLVGAHAPRYNSISIGICVIGDWRTELPPEQQLAAIHQLIAKGVREGKIVEDYKLVGHRQVRDTECPGDRLYEEIKKWKGYFTNPDYKVYQTHGNSPPVVSLVHDNKIKKRASHFVN